MNVRPFLGQLSYRGIFVLSAGLLALAHCTGGSTGSGIDAAVDARVDATLDVPATTRCGSDIECSDGVYCNGIERCAPSAAGANAMGCLAGTPPCPATQTCNEGMQHCLAADCMHPDMDGDGHNAIACGGDDCNDNDANRFPGNAEVCRVLGGGDAGGPLTRSDPAHMIDPTHDEDCNPTTFANAMTHDGDHDGDGYIDVACSNMDSSGMVYRGTDCADLSPVAAVPASLGLSVAPGGIHPTAPELCNGVDDNCDGNVDEGNPGGGGMCVAGVGICAPGTTQCTAGAIACVGTVTPRMEVCNGLDDNCNGMTDEAPAVASCPAAPANGTATCIAGVCGFACNSPYTNCSGSCATLGACDNSLSGLCRQTGSLACGTVGGVVCNLVPLTWPGDQTYTGDDPHLSHDCGDGLAPGQWNVYQGFDATVPSYPQRGPLIDLPAGDYAVGFDVSTSPTGDVTWAAEVTSDPGASPVATGAPYYVGTVRWLPFHISAACATGVEFRVHLLAMIPDGNARFPTRLEINSTTLQRH